MAYTLTAAADIMNIAEQQYGMGNEIRFTVFTSCIGIIARHDDVLTGVHLVMFDSNDEPFDDTGVEETIQILGGYDQIVVIGQTGMWADNLPGPYGKLIGELNNPTIIDQDNGIYGGRVNGGVFQTYRQPEGQQGEYVNV